MRSEKTKIIFFLPQTGVGKAVKMEEYCQEMIYTLLKMGVNQSPHWLVFHFLTLKFSFSRLPSSYFVFLAPFYFSPGFLGTDFLQYLPQPHPLISFKTICHIFNFLRLWLLRFLPFLIRLMKASLIKSFHFKVTFFTLMILLKKREKWRKFKVFIFPTLKILN